MVDRLTVLVAKVPRTMFAVLTVSILAAPVPTAVQAQQSAEIDRSFAVALIRDTLTAINHGNWTGNYTVLRDYASRDFSNSNDPTKLAGLFAPVRQVGLDMLPVLVVEPEIVSQKVNGNSTQMQLTGYFPIRPEHISFDIIYVREQARWVLLDVSVGKFPAINPTSPGSPGAQGDPTQAPTTGPSSPPEE